MNKDELLDFILDAVKWEWTMFKTTDAVEPFCVAHPELEDTIREFVEKLKEETSGDETMQTEER